MANQNLCEILKGNPYPGRGIVLGCAENGENAYMAYFIMGRSENSRNRVFAAKNGGIVTQAANPAKLTEPSLIIYAPVLLAGSCTIVGNGLQTATIQAQLQQGGSFAGALRSHQFEPDAPNYTPRISGLVCPQESSFFYSLAIIKTAGGNPQSIQRFFYEYSPLAGQGHFICTYKNANPQESFTGEPVPVLITGSIDDFANNIWQALNPENKVALFVRSLCGQGMEQSRIFNKYTQI